MSNYQKFSVHNRIHLRRTITAKLLVAAAVVAALTGFISVPTESAALPMGHHHEPLPPEAFLVTGDTQLPRTGWTVTADSQQGSYPATNVIDGNNATIWHTQYSPTATPLPHTITIDMHATNSVTGLRILPRQDHPNGRVGGYQIHISPDGAAWGNPVATGTFADDARLKEIPFTPVSGRFVRLTALTEAGNRGPWSTTAELNLTGSPVPTIPRAGWSVSAGSQQSAYPASNTIDGNPATFWHTQYSPTVAPLPHIIVIDMHATNAVTGLRYLPRQDHPNGRIGSYQIHVSPDGTWGNPVATGTFADDATEKAVSFAPTVGRYVKLTALTEAGNRGPWTTAAELNLTGAMPTAGPQQTGSWGPTIGFPIVPVGAAQLPGGTMLTWSSFDPYNYEGGTGGKTQTATMNSTNGTVSRRTVTETGHDMFCPGTARLPDGQLMINGGNDSAKTSIYNPANNGWTAGASMIIPRGYQSAVTLSDGRVFTIGGSFSGGTGGKDGEVWSASTGWRRLSGVPVTPILTNDPQGVFRADNHAWLFAVPGGRAFHAGPSRQLNWFNANGNGSYASAGNRADDQHAMNGVAVMYDVGKIFTAGGATAYNSGAPASNRAYVIDISNWTTASARRVANMTYARAFANGVVLPDGKVVVIGGVAVATSFSDTGAALNAELWNPATESFTTLAAMAVPRPYHSVAMLLPDGRVFSGGGGLCGSCTVNHLDGQLLSPPYLFGSDGQPAPRPAITGAPATASLGATVTVTTDRAVSGFSLVRMGSVTHSVNTDQRRVPLVPIAANGTSYTLQLPADPGVAVPGYWMLFALDAGGVPSVAATIRLASSQ